MKKTIGMFVSALICLFVGMIGSIFTLPSIATWYAMLKKPFFVPPNWLFGPVWTLLYILMGISAYLVWEKGLMKKEVRLGLYFFAAQLVLNLLWSVIFFGFHVPLIAFAEIVLLWASIAMTILIFWEVSVIAAYLMAPYILWVTFAAALNFSIMLINR